jgi:hypothetical protein
LGAGAAYQAVQATVPSLLALLNEDDVRLRRAVARLLAWSPRIDASSSTRRPAQARFRNVLYEGDATFQRWPSGSLK